MCTVSWHFSDVGYQLFFNRDELLTRQRALAPSLKESQQVHFIAPTDPDAGGTWISVNQFGLTLCLLNNYGAQAALTGNNWISRGQLVCDLAHLADVTSIQRHIENITLSNYRPFDLLALSMNSNIRLLSWDGFELNITNNPGMPLTSSSFDTDQVIANRLQQFARTDSAQPDDLASYHASHQPERGPFSVCMHRDNGQTVSFSHIHVESEVIRFRYFDGPPCSTPQAQVTELNIQPYTQPDVA